MQKSLRILLATISIAGLLLTSGCGEKDKLASVNGKTITNAQFDAYLKFKRINVTDDTKRTQAVDQYLQREALTAAIEKTDVLDKAMIEAELNEFRKEMLVSRYFETFLKDKVTDEAIRNYYVANEKTYQQRQVHVAHILLRTNRNMGEAEKQAKLTTAQEAYSKIKKGEDFAEIAKNYSEDTISGKKGGDLGWLKEGSIDKRFSEKVFSMQPGEVSEPFETNFGYHIVKLIDGPRTVTKPFDAVKGDIRYKLRNQAKQAELERLSSSVKVTK
jgi:peptidyl-prolyl cis-trans isomerase C